MPRIAPPNRPMSPPIAAELARIMPPGVSPLVLFRTMARSPRVFARMFAGGLLDKGPLGLRQREIVIDRTTARLGCEYEWGVHIAFFAERVGFTAEHVAATVNEPRDAACWTPEEQALLALVDDLVDRRAIGRGDLDAARRRTSTRRRSSRRSPWWATTTRSASSVSASNCRSKATPPAFPAIAARRDLADPSHDAAPAGAHGVVGEVVLRATGSRYGPGAAACRAPRAARSR